MLHGSEEHAEGQAEIEVSHGWAGVGVDNEGWVEPWRRLKDRLSGGFFGREGEGVDGGVGLGGGAEDLFEGGLAAVVGGLTDEQDGTAVGGGLLLEETERVGEGVEDGGSVVAVVGVVDGVFPLGYVGGEG